MGRVYREDQFATQFGTSGLLSITLYTLVCQCQYGANMGPPYGALYGRVSALSHKKMKPPHAKKV